MTSNASQEGKHPKEELWQVAVRMVESQLIVYIFHHKDQVGKSVGNW